MFGGSSGAGAAAKPATGENRKRSGTPLSTILAISVILASAVNLSWIYYATNQPRVIRTTVFELEASGTAAGIPRPAVPIEKALVKGDVNSVKQHMYWCMKDKNCNLEKNLQAAVASNDPTMAKVLLKAGANVNTKDKDLETPLHNAAVKGRTGVAKVLLDAGADVNARDEDGLTPLHTAAVWGHVELARMLLAAGADVNARDRRNETPLHLVASRRVPPLSVYADMTRLLLDAGARPNARATDGTTPLGRAEVAASRLTLDGNMKAAGDANEVVSLLRGSRGYH